MDSQLRRWTGVAALLVAAASVALTRPVPVAASAMCPPPPATLAGLIAPDAVNTGPLTDEFRPIYGSYAEAAASCWGTAEISVIGFVAGPEGLGGTRAYTIDPQWMVSRAHWLSTTSKVDPESGPVGPFFAVAVPPTLEDRFSAFGAHWVTVSGHFNDPAAETCVVTEGTLEPGVVPAPEQTIATCRTAFALTSVDAIAVPPTDSVSPTAGPRESPDRAGVAIAVVAALGLVLGLRRFRSGHHVRVDR
jgi:hypothetical protein